MASEEITTLSDLLRAINAEYLLEVFHKEHVEFDELPELNNQEWQQLVKPIGLRKKLAAIYPEAGTSTCKTEILSPSEISETNTTLESLADTDISLLDEQDHNDGPPKKIQKCPMYFAGGPTLEAYLDKHPRTREFMAMRHRIKEPLDEDWRKTLVEVIADGLLDRHKSVAQVLIRDVAEDLCILFPCESRTLYYQRPRKSREVSSSDGNLSMTPRGKLYDRVSNERRTREAMLRKLAKSTSPTPKTEKACLVGKDQVEAKGWIKYHSQPLATLFLKWDVSRPLRLQESCKSTTFQDFVMEWPKLASEIGPELVST